MPSTIHLEPRTGVAVTLERGALLGIIDCEGQQVADVVAFARKGPAEWLSNGRTFDYEKTLRLTTGHTLYSNRSRAMLTIVEDTVGRHDFLYAACSPEMFHIQYGEDDHPSCVENLSSSLARYGVSASTLPTPFNVFMNVEVRADGTLEILAPRSGPGDSLTLRAEMDLVLGVAACSAGKCNAEHCTAIDLEPLDAP